MTILCNCNDICACCESLTFILVDGKAGMTPEEQAQYEEWARVWEPYPAEGTRVEREHPVPEPAAAVEAAEDTPPSPPPIRSRRFYSDGVDSLGVRIAQPDFTHPCETENAWSMRDGIPAVRVQIHTGATRAQVQRVLAMILAQFDTVLHEAEAEWDWWAAQWDRYHAANELLPALPDDSSAEGEGQS
jgi:hypothetical protein